mgnify:FL=1
MPVARSPSDYNTIDADYSQGKGFYTDADVVADLLQIPEFTNSTNPTLAQVGSIIKRVEGIMDEKMKRTYRPIIFKNEVHNFQFIKHPMQSYYGGYIGFIQLDVLRLRKVVSLRVWQGNSYKELASAQASVTLLDNFRDIYSITLQLPNNGTEFEMLADSNGVVANDEFDIAFGVKTTAKDITYLVNGQYPSNNAQFTGASAPKSLTVSGREIEDFFYAFTDSEDSTKINFSSLLSGEDGSDCNIKIKLQQSCTTVNADATLTVEDSSKLVKGMSVTGTGIPANTTISSITNSTSIELSNSATADGTVTLTFTATNLSVPTVATVDRFTDKQDMKRLGSFWTIGEESKIFFLRDYPYHTNHSIVVSYIAGDGRVNAEVHDIATKLTAAEILRHDDQTILIAETGGNISVKEKYDILRKEAMEALKGKGDLVHFIE